MSRTIGVNCMICPWRGRRATGPIEGCDLCADTAGACACARRHEKAPCPRCNSRLVVGVRNRDAETIDEVLTQALAAQRGDDEAMVEAVLSAPAEEVAQSAEVRRGLRAAVTRALARAGGGPMIECAINPDTGRYAFASGADEAREMARRLRVASGGAFGRVDWFETRADMEAAGFTEALPVDDFITQAAAYPGTAGVRVVPRG